MHPTQGYTVVREFKNIDGGIYSPSIFVTSKGCLLETSVFFENSGELSACDITSFFLGAFFLKYLAFFIATPFFIFLHGFAKRDKIHG